MNRVSLTSGAALAIALALTTPAYGADTSAPAGALFRQGREDMAKGNYDQACSRFSESLRLLPAVGTMLNLADCEEHRGRVADALANFQHALDAMAKNDDRNAYARGRIAKLQPRVPHVRLVPSGGPLSVELDGVQLGDAALDVPLPVNPGARTVVVHASGRQDRSYSVQVAEGATLDVAIQPGDLLPARELDAKSDARVTPVATPSRAAAWTSLAIGGTGLAVGTVSGLLALGLAGKVRDNCPNHECTSSEDVERASTGKTLTVVSTLGFGVGVVGVGLATYLFLRHGAATKPAFTQGWTDVSPMVSAGTAGISLTRTFR
ncbi:hypothetical protein AKJ09_02884 [Labilithrix luteola]|uniref:Tetratricopeptide repeat protein n=1 Tax=Labilithrix luteola TaxID=1391654 RepID=A0A0K1PRR0_9BACT|nr:tetratricopeptide repeat protein [Labilithrix luteola]AKU96220.1 hypothetical protein AKJ09_02884 [Labilithrix luteola]